MYRNASTERIVRQHRGTRLQRLHRIRALLLRRQLLARTDAARWTNLERHFHIIQAIDAEEYFESNSIRGVKHA